MYLYGRNAVSKGKLWPHGKILLIVASLLYLPTLLYPFQLLHTVLPEKYEVCLVHFIVLSAVLFSSSRSSSFPQRAAKRDWGRLCGAGQDEAGWGGSGN